MATIVRDTPENRAKYFRRYLENVKLEEADSKAYSDLEIELSINTKNASIENLDTLGGVYTEEQKANRKLYLEIANEAVLKTRFKLRDWWRAVRAKYGIENIPDTARVDTNHDKFYEVIDENGNPSEAEFEFMPSVKE